MRRLRWVSGAVALGLMSMGCEDDAKKPAPDTAEVVDVADVGDVESDTESDTQSDSESDTDGDAASDTAPDTAEVEVVDPCVPDPCGAPPAGHCSLDLKGLVAYGTTCVAEGGEAVCHPPSVTPCEEGSLCLDGACAAVASPCEFPFGDRLGITTRLVPGDQSEVIVAATGEREDACCEDFDGDGSIDNGFGDSARALAPLIGSAETVWGAALSRGRPVMELRGLDDLVDDPEVWVYGYGGREYDAEAGTALLVTQAFDPEDSRPLAAGRGYVEGGVLHVTDGYQRFAFGDRDAPIYVETRSWHVRGQLVPADGGQGVGLEGVDGAPAATMSGLADHEAMLQSFNAHALLFCTCTEFADLDEPVIDVASGACRPIEDRAPSCDEPEAFCKILTSELCDFIVSQFTPDVDTDGDGDHDAMSVGWWTTLAPMTATGILECR